MTMENTDNGRYHMSGYLVDNTVLYKLTINYSEESAEAAKELMYQWADQY